VTTQYAVLSAPTGLTLTAKLFTLAAPDTTAFTADSVTERTNAKGQYVASFGEESAISGDHTLILFSGTRPVAIGYRTFAGTDTEVSTETPPTVELDSAVLAQLNAIEDDSAASVGYLDTLVGRLTANAATAIQNLWHMITGTGAASKFTAGSLENAAGASGDWTNTEKAQIRYRLGLEGTATAPAEPDVDPIVITPATGILTTGYLVTRVRGVPTAGITIRYQQAQEPAADRGSSYDDSVYSAVSNSQGIAELSLVKGGLYYVWRTAQSRPMNVKAYRVLKSDGSAPDATLALPSHVGA
jgi:hypothetical protein